MKKFLSLVLALIMTMSLVTISAGATEYKDLTDKDEIEYEEAVAVLNRIGVITGYEDGSFRPETELTRGAAAKIIVSLLIGPEAASNLPNATAPYPDVPASHTFAGVISYCKTAKIISGYGDGTFKPGNSLTGFAFAKMLLGALGYSSEIEGFVDTGWTMNVAKVGNVAGLFDRLDFDGAGAVNRETACQLALNTLKATMVTYGGTTMVTGAQTLAVANTQAMYKTSNNREINANINRRVISAQNNELTLEFGEEHFKDLRLEHDKYDPAYDNYGRPSDEWSWKKVTVGTFPLPADFTFTTQMAHREDTVASKEKALGLRNYDTYSTDHRAAGTNWSSPSNAGGWNSPFADATQITIDGWDARVLNSSYAQTPAPARSQQDTHAMQNGNLYSYNAFSITAANRAQAPSIAEICDLTDNGVTVEVYVCPVDADFITNVVVTRTQLMKVDRLGSDFVTLDRISPDSRDPRRTPTDGLRKITGYNAFSVDYEVEDVKDDNFDAYETLKGLKVGDYVAVVPYTADQGQTYEVGEAYVPETVSGSLSDVGLYMNTNWPEGNATSITIGGTRYVINEWNLDMLSVKKGQINSTRKDVTGYLAKDGTILWATEIGNSDDWMIVGDYYQAANTSGKVVWFVHGWTIGNEEVDLDLGTIRQEAEIYAPGELVHYELATGGTGEYVLGKPNDTGFSSWYSTDGNQEPEDVEVDGQGRRTGEGVYNVAQWVKNNGVDRAYEIHPANSMIPLEDYGNYKITSPFNTSVGGAIHGDEDAATAPHAWDYRSTTYKDNGVKFIYVNFDEGTGEVDYISVRKDAQSVENRELAFQNIYWNNVATNVTAPNQMKWVVSPAEAYVNEDGNVEAVVIKSEPTVADLSNVIVVGESVGAEIGKSTGAETTTPTNSHAREYWQGPDFSEKKTGYFKNQHNVGDIVVIRSIDDNNVMDCKMFNSGNYSDRNPDVFLAAGIKPLKSAMDKTSKIAFYVGDGNHTVLSQNRSTNLKTSGSTIMSDLKVEADDLLDLDELQGGYKGLVKVAGAKWIDLRANRGSKDVRSLSDLLDLNNDSVRITVLVNANSSHDNFRRAYAIVVTGGWDETDDAAAATVTLSAQTVALPIVPVPFTGNGTKTSPFVISMPAGTWVQLTANPTVTTGNIVAGTARWIVEGQSSLNRDGNVVMAQAPATAPVTNLTYVVNTRDDSATGNREVTKTVYVELRNSGYVDTTATITLNPSVAGVNLTVFNAAGAEIKANADGTFTLEQNTTYTVKAEGYKDATITTGKDAAQTITVTLTPEGEEPTPTKEFTVAGPEGAQVNFNNQAGETVVTATAGTAVEIPTGEYLTAVAVDSANHALAYKNVGDEPVPFAAFFKAENVDSIRIYVKGSGRVPSPAWDADASNGGNGLTFIPAETSAAAAAEVLAETSVQNAPAASEDIIKVTTSAGDAFLAAPTTGLNAGLYTLITADGGGNACPATIAQVVTALINGAAAEEATRDDVVYGPVTPVESETIKAEIAIDRSITFFAYYGPAASSPAPVLTKEQVLGAIKAAAPLELDDSSLDMAKGEIKSASGAVTYTFDTVKTNGSYQKPNRLYKVTVTGKDDQYIKGINGKLENLGSDLAGLLAEDTVVASSVIAVADGAATIPSVTKDCTYVPAVELAEAIPAAILVKVVDSNDVRQAVDFATTKYVQKGVELLVINANALNTNINATLTVNGVAKAIKFGADGSLNETVTFTDWSEDPTKLSIKLSNGLDVYMDDVLVQKDGKVGGQYTVGKAATGAVVAWANTTDDKLVLTDCNASVDASGVYTVSQSHVNPATGEIRLYTAWTLAASNGFADWKADVELNDDGDDLKTTGGLTADKLVKNGGKIYVKAADYNTMLKVADAAAGKNLTLGTAIQTPADDKYGIWEVTVGNNVVAASIVKGLTVADSAKTLDSRFFNASSSEEQEEEITFTVTGVKKGDAVTHEWTANPYGLIVKKLEASADNTIKLTLLGRQPVPAGEVVAKMIIKVGGLSFEASFKTGAGVNGTALTNAVAVAAVPAVPAVPAVTAVYKSKITVNKALSATDTIEINGGTALTVVASGATGNEINAADVDTAAHLAAYIAGNVTVTGYTLSVDAADSATVVFTATSAGAVGTSGPTSAAALTLSVTDTDGDGSSATAATATATTAGAEAVPAVSEVPAITVSFTGLNKAAIVTKAESESVSTAGNIVLVENSSHNLELKVGTTVLGTSTAVANGAANSFTFDSAAVGTVTFTANLAQDALVDPVDTGLRFVPAAS